MVACLDARAASEAYTAANSENARSMAPDQVSYYLELEELCDEHLRATGIAEAERKRRQEMKSFEGLPY